MALWLGAVLIGTGDRRPARRASRRRAEAVHHPFHRGSAQPAVPARLLHLRLERSDRLRGAEHRRARRRDRDRPLVSQADLLVRLFSDRRHHLAARRARAAAAREGVDQGRRARAAVLLRIGLGGLLGVSRRCGCCGKSCRAPRSATASSSSCSSAILAFVGNLARLGRLPRTRPIVPGEIAVSD